MNNKVGERSELKKFKYNKSYTKKKKHICYEKIWIYCIYCININIGVVYQKYYIVSGL